MNAPAPPVAGSLEAAFRASGTPHVAATPLEEVCGLLRAGAEVEHALLVEYLYAAWSVADPTVAGRVIEIAIQEMCHFVTVQNLLLFAGDLPYLNRQDQDPNPALAPFPFRLRPLTKTVLEEFLLAEMPPLQDMTAEQRQVMQPIIDAHRGTGGRGVVHPVGLIYARIFWLLQKDGQPTQPWPEAVAAGLPGDGHVGEFAGRNTFKTFQVDPLHEVAWQPRDARSGIFETINSRETALKAIADIAAQGEGLTSTPGADSHFKTFLDIYQTTAFDQMGSPQRPTDPFVSDQPSADPEREANRVTNKLAAALCGVFDLRYQIMLASLRNSFSRDRTSQTDLIARNLYTSWAFEEMLGSIKTLYRAIRGLPCKDGGTVAELSAAPSFRLSAKDLPDTSAGLDALLLSLHQDSKVAIAGALALNPGVVTRNDLQHIQNLDLVRFPNLNIPTQLKEQDMAKQYRIYPGIGIARVGNSTTEFFLAPEVPGLGPLELTPDDAIVPVRRFKDATQQHALRRQGARFRIFESSTDAAGIKTDREVTAGNGVEIEWRVELANEKSAAGKFVSALLPEDTLHLRNPHLAQPDLVIKPAFAPIKGAGKTVTAAPEGKFRGQPVYLGELRTDAKGRLIVLGGRGVSGPHGLPVGDGSQLAGHDKNSFANNVEWHDDVADGPVSATVRIPGQPDVVLTNAAWVVVAPPDFAPYTGGITTLYDVAAQAAGFQAPATPSFQDNVLPLLKAAAGLRWVSSLTIWGTLSTDYVQLSMKGNPKVAVQAAADQARRDYRDLLFSVEDASLVQFHLTANQKLVLNSWAAGSFVSNFNPNAPVAALTPEGLDRASLSQAVGGGFFPGIEAGIKMTSPLMYSTPFRITSAPFNYLGVPQTPHAGFITRNMACPWQSDFFECAHQTTDTVWWPAQRPIEVFVDAQAKIQKPWIDSIPDHQALVDKFWKLGLVQPLAGSTAEPFVEAERSMDVPHV